MDVGEQIELKRNFGFVQFSAVEEATRALEALNGTKVPPSLLPGLSTPNLGSRRDAWSLVAEQWPARAHPNGTTYACNGSIGMGGVNNVQMVDRVISVEYVARGSVESR